MVSTDPAQTLDFFRLRGRQKAARYRPDQRWGEVAAPGEGAAGEGWAS